MKSIPRWRCQNLPAVAVFWKGQIPRLHIWPLFRRCVPKAFKKKRTSAPPAAGAEASELPLARCRDEPGSVSPPRWPWVPPAWGNVGGCGVGAGCLLLLLLSSKSLRKPSTEATDGAGGGASVHNWSLTTKKKKEQENFLRAEATALPYQLLTS